MTTLDPAYLDALSTDPSYSKPMSEPDMVALLKRASRSWSGDAATLIVEVRRSRNRIAALEAGLDRACNELDVLGSKQADRIRADGGTGGGQFSIKPSTGS